MKKLSISTELDLPVDAVTQKLAAIGRTGSGKSYFATKLAEEMLSVGAQIVVVDVVGIWWGLRLGVDGKSPGLSIPVFGGLHGDIPLEPTAGKLIADLIVDKGISVVLDISQFESDSDKAKLATDFGDRFFFRKKSSPSAVHVFVEECQEIIPQNIQRGEERMLHAWQRMIRLGRNFGIGATLITQRPQDVNKKALNQAECVFAFQLTGPQERKAIDLWMSDKGLDLDLASDLPKLSIGEAHVWSPAWLKISKTVKIGKKKTFNASSTPEVGRRSQSHDLAKIDLESLHEQMKATIERAKADDPKELKKQIAELQNQIKKKDAVLAVNVEKIKPRQVPVLSSKEIDKIILLAEKVQALTDQFQKELQGSYAKIAGPMIAYQNQERKQSMRDHGAYPAHTIGPKKIPIVRASASEDNSLSRCERAILQVLATRNGMKTDRGQLGILSGYSSTSGSFSNSLSSLRTKGFLVGSDPLSITENGLGVVGEYEEMPTGQALHNYWYSKLDKACKTILSVLIDAEGRTLSREEIGALSGYSHESGSFSNSLSKLRTLQLIEGSKEIKAADIFFE